MTHTVPLDELWRDRRAANSLNEILRHCRIGRVFHKFTTASGTVVSTRLWMGPQPAIPGPLFYEPAPMFMDKCGCRVGSACGNAACPHRTMVTFGRGDISQPPIVPSHGVLM